MSAAPVGRVPGNQTGPLVGLRVVEIGSIGPGPFCAMVLADQGADVLRVDRRVGGGLVGPNADPTRELLHRGRRSAAVDLRRPEGVEVALRLADQADVLIEGQRPGVAERLGIGPDACQARNARLVYGRMTGWGQDGPYAGEVGHDLNYLAVSGTLSLIGRRGQPPTVPPAVVGDFGGGGLLLAFGVMAALWERERSGVGQVVDAAILDGAALLATAFHGFWQSGSWGHERGTNMVDSGSPYYEVYETADGRWLTVAAIEPAFHADLLAVLDLDPADLPAQDDRAAWPAIKERVAAAIRRRTSAEWVARAAGTNACMAPVLDLDEAAADVHVRHREVIVDHLGMAQPAPAPRFSRTVATLGRRPPAPGEHTEEALEDWGFSPAEVAGLIAAGVIGRP